MEITKYSMDQAYYPLTWENYFSCHSSSFSWEGLRIGLIKGVPERYSTCFLFKPDNTKVKPWPISKHNWVILWVKMTCNFKWNSIYQTHNATLYRQGDFMHKVIMCNNFHEFIENILKWTHSIVCSAWQR